MLLLKDNMYDRKNLVGYAGLGDFFKKVWTFGKKLVGRVMPMFEVGKAIYDIIKPQAN